MRWFTLPRLLVAAALAGAGIGAGPGHGDPLFDEACEGLNATLDICTGRIVPAVTVGSSGEERFHGLEVSLTVAGEVAERYPTDHYRVSWRVGGCTHLVSYDLMVEDAGWVATLFEICGERVTPIELPHGSATVSGRTLTWQVDASSLAETTAAYGPGVTLTAPRALTQSGVTTWTAGELLRTVDSADGRYDVTIGTGS